MEEMRNEKSLYLLKDKKLNDVVGSFLLKDYEVEQHFSELANDVRSPFYKRQEDFVIYKKGIVRDDDLAILESDYSFVKLLSEYVDVNRINQQFMIQALNYLPVGYFKMPKEKQEQVEEDIKSAINLYVEMYAKNNLSDDLIKICDDNKRLLDENALLKNKISVLQEQDNDVEVC